jgi:hypothetical protein
MPTADVDATNLPVLRDADGTPIPFQGRVHQVAVDEAHGAQPFRLHPQGHAIGRGVRLLYVRFSVRHEALLFSDGGERPSISSSS